MRKRDLEQCRTLLVEQRERILGGVGRVLSGELDVDSDDLPDELDTAVAESSSSFTGQMREREERLLAKIDRMLEKIGQGTYGECEGLRRRDRSQTPGGAPGGQPLHRLQRGAGAGRAPARVSRGRGSNFPDLVQTQLTGNSRLSIVMRLRCAHRIEGRAGRDARRGVCRIPSGRCRSNGRLAEAIPVRCV